MAAEAEAAREARAKIIRAHGEEKATQALKQAADELAHNPHAIQLRYLQVCTLKYIIILSGSIWRREANQFFSLDRAAINSCKFFRKMELGQKSKLDPLEFSKARHLRTFMPVLLSI